MLEFWTFAFLVILNILHTGHSILTQEDSSSASLITLDVPRSDLLDNILEHEFRLLQTNPDKNEIVMLVVDQDISKDESNLSSNLKPIVKQRPDVSKLKQTRQRSILEYKNSKNIDFSYLSIEMEYE